MTRQLHTDKEAFREITTLAADTLGYEQSHVEKDYWLSKLLFTNKELPPMDEVVSALEYLHLRLH